MQQYKVVPYPGSFTRNLRLIGSGEIHSRSETAKVIIIDNDSVMSFEQYSFDEKSLNNMTIIVGNGTYSDESTWTDVVKYVQTSDWDNNVASFSRYSSVRVLGLLVYSLIASNVSGAAVFDNKQRLDRVTFD